MTDRIPRQGEIYRHFKDKLYQIVAIAIHSETRESMVVYQALYGDFKTYVRSLDMFISEVDKQKYPEVEQKYRFELVNLNENRQIEKTDNKINTNNQINTQNQISTEGQENKDVWVNNNSSNNPEAGEVNSILLEFLDANTYEQKLISLLKNKKYIDEKLINNIAAALDCTLNEGDLEQKLNEIIYCLQTLVRFESNRLR